MQIKNFLPTTPLSSYDPTNREACHFRIIPKSFTYKNKKLLLLSLSDIVRVKAGRAHRSRLADYFQIPTTDNLPHMIKIFSF